VELMQLQGDMCQPGCMHFLGGKVSSLGGSLTILMTLDSEDSQDSHDSQDSFTISSALS
jgi:hypothetical protein